MRFATLAFLIVVSASAQTTADRVIRFNYIETEQGLKEAATLIRMIGEINKVSLDTAQKALSMHGTPEQLALADWLHLQLDQPADRQNRESITPEHRMGPGANDVVRVYQTRCEPKTDRLHQESRSQSTVPLCRAATRTIC